MSWSMNAMKMTREELFQAALALNGEDKKYQITVEGDTIVTRVKWMDATFFSPDAITAEMQEFEYRVRIFSNGKYTELDKSVSTKKSAGHGGVGMNKSVFVGKQISFNKTVGVGQDNTTGEVGIIHNTFYSEEYKAPVRNLLQAAEYKKKMGTTGKIFLFGGIGVAVILAIVLTVLLLIGNKQAITVGKFEEFARSKGYRVATDYRLQGSTGDIKENRIAQDQSDDYQVEFYVLADADTAKQFFALNKNMLQESASASSGSGYNAVNTSNYEMFAASTTSDYLFVARIDNTVVFSIAGIEDKAEVEAFIKGIGY